MMQKALLTLFIFSIITFTSAFQSYEIETLWETWKLQHQKSYAGAEESIRFAIFSHNFKKINKWNSENDTPKLGLNKFADLTHDEFKYKKTACGFYETDSKLVESRTKTFENVDLPSSVDWRSKGAVTPVKDQGDCGACYAFSTTGVLEGFHFINNNTLVSFSEQQIVDCDNTTDQGCHGGWPYLAIQYAAKFGLEAEEDYPYNADDNACAYNQSKATHVNNNYAFVTPNSTDQLKNAVVSMPVSVLVEADQDVFQFYMSGVIKTGCGANLNHAVLVVGYHEVGFIEAFIVKNSWGFDWGESGYCHIWSNGAANGGEGVCGILAQPIIATN